MKFMGTVRLALALCVFTESAMGAIFAVRGSRAGALLKASQDPAVAGAAAASNETADAASNEPTASNASADAASNEPVAPNATADDASNAPAASNATADAASSGTPDNFADEIVDQANPEFQMTDLDGDGCITFQELVNPLKLQFNNSARAGLSPEQKKSMSKRRKAAFKAMEANFKAADLNGDGCTDKAEFKKAKDSDMKIDLCPEQFHLMDTSGDGKISQNEAWDYVSEMMDNADLTHEKTNQIWTAADHDKDGSLKLSEFCTAGQRYAGDGQGK